MALPPPPPGFRLDQAAAGSPPPPPGFIIDAAPPAPAPRGSMDDLGAYTRGVASGIAYFDPAGMAANLGTRATDAMGMTDGANAAVRRAMGYDPAQTPPDKYKSGGRVVGQMMGAIPTAAVMPANALGVLGGGAVSGAVTSEADNGADFLADTAFSAAASLGGNFLGQAFGRGVSPNIRPEVKALADRKIPMTIGQIVGGTAQTIEDTLTSIPLVNKLVTGARERGQEAFRRVAVDEALEPIGVKLPSSIPTGHKAMLFVKETFRKGYDDVLNKMSVAADQDFSTALAALGQKASTMSGEAGKQFNAFLATEVLPKFKNGVMAGRDLKLLERELRDRIKRYSVSTTGADMDVTELFKGLRATVRDGASRTSGPQLSGQLDALDSAYANHIPLRDAASKAKGGKFSPVSLDTSVRVADRSVGKGAKATGQARMQVLSDSARQVQPSLTGNSGTADRLFSGALLSGQIPLGLLSAKTLVPPALLSLAYTKTGQRAAQSFLMRGQGAKATAVKGMLGRGGRFIGAGVPPLLARDP